MCADCDKRAARFTTFFNSLIFPGQNSVEKHRLLLSQNRWCFLQFFVYIFQKMHCKRENVFFAFTKRGEVNAEFIETMVQIFSELSFLAASDKFSFDATGMRTSGEISAVPPIFFIFLSCTNTKEQCLNIVWQIGNFIQKQSPAFSHFKLSCFRDKAPVKAPFLVTKQFTSCKVFWQCATVKCYKGFSCTFTFLSCMDLATASLLTLFLQIWWHWNL